MSNVATAPADGKGKITFIDAAGNEVEPGSSDAITVQTEGFKLFPNGAIQASVSAAALHAPLQDDQRRTFPAGR
ncbi:MAG: hypothetical protein WA231_17475 [Methylocella sp.]